jgi:hypothetical protein
MGILGTMVRISPEYFAALQKRGDMALSEVMIDRSIDNIDLEKHWDILGFLLGRAGAPVNIVAGGAPFPVGDYVDEFRYFRPDEVVEAHRFLASLDVESLMPLLDHEAVREHRIYPPGWDWAENTNAIRTTFAEIARLVAAAAVNGQYVLVWNE